LTKTLKSGWAIATIILMAAIVRLPFGSELRAGFEFNVRIAIVLIFAIWLYSNVNKWVGLFLGLSTFSFCIPYLVLTGSEIQTRQSYIALDWVVFGCVLYALISKMDIGEENIYIALAIIVCVNVLFLIVQRMNIDPYAFIGMKGNYAPTGLMANRNEVSSTIAICSPVFFRAKWWPLIGVSLIGLYLSSSLGGMIGFCAIVILFFTIKEGYDRKNTLFFLGTAVCILLILIDIYLDGSKNIKLRFDVWVKAIRLSFANQPFLGFGLGNWILVNDKMVESNSYSTVASWSRLHNSFVQGYVEMGIGFIVIVIAYFRQIIKNVKYSIPVLALGPIVVCCSTNSLFRMNAINGMIVIVWLALLNRRIYGRSV
jgi:hypothetical protein